MAPASFSMVPSGSGAVAGTAWAATCVHSRTFLRCKRARLRLKVLCPTQLVQAAVLALALFIMLYTYRLGCCSLLEVTALRWLSHLSAAGSVAPSLHSLHKRP